MKIVCEIPVRAGSKRVPNKNIRKVNNQRIVEYIIDVAVKSGVFDEIWINTNSQIIIEEHENGKLLHAQKVKIYKRPEILCSDTATSDDFNYDFAKNVKSDMQVMLNPVCPLILPDTVKAAVNAFQKHNEFDTLISCSKTQMQSFVDNEPINFDDSGVLRPSQENKEVKILNWAITAWRTEKLIQRQENFGFCVLGEKRQLFDVSPIEGVKVSTEDDFNLMKGLLLSRC